MQKKFTNGCMAKLIIIGGAPATGKTSLARTLQELTGIARVSMDEIKEALFDVVGYKDRAWSQEVGKMAWPVFQQTVHMYLDRGVSIIAEATFLYPDDADWLHALADRHGVELIQIWMTSNPIVARERFIHRANTIRHPGHNDALESVMEEFDERFFNKSFIPLPLRGRTRVIDTTQGYVGIEDVLDFIG